MFISPDPQDANLIHAMAVRALAGHSAGDILGPVRPAALVFVLAAACGSQGPPVGPEHTPVNSPEARSGCPAEWKRAKQAREDPIGTAGAARERAARAAAQAVLAQAECEHRRFDSWRIDAGSQGMMAAELRGARRYYLSTRTLYEEATRYGDAATSVGAWARLADLHLAFAQKLDRMPAPVDVQAPDARSDYRRQMRQLMSTFEIEAALAAARALDAAGGTARPRSRAAARATARLAAWVRTSCEKLAVLDPDSLAGYPACAGPRTRGEAGAVSLGWVAALVAVARAAEMIRRAAATSRCLAWPRCRWCRCRSATPPRRARRRWRRP